jgi:hypothetical protein
MDLISRSLERESARSTEEAESPFRACVSGVVPSPLLGEPFHNEPQWIFIRRGGRTTDFDSGLPRLFYKIQVIFRNFVRRLGPGFTRQRIVGGCE